MQELLEYFLENAIPKKLPPLYHLSFRDNLEGIWKPRPPDGFQVNGGKADGPSYSEPETPRISLSPTYEQCFYAIYPNISFYFEEDKIPYMQFAAYQPRLTGKERIWTPEYLTSNRLVHDAYITDEHCVLDNVFMEHVATVTVYNTTKNSEIFYHPFNDKSLPKRFLAYEVKKIKVK